MSHLLANARRKLRADRVAFVMVNGDGLHDALGAMARAGFVRVRTVTWDRRYPGLGGGLRHQTEFVLVGLLPGSRTLTGVDLVSVSAVGPGTAGRYLQPRSPTTWDGSWPGSRASVRATSSSTRSSAVGRSSSALASAGRSSSAATSRRPRSAWRRPNSSPQGRSVTHAHRRRTASRPVDHEPVRKGSLAPAADPCVAGS